MDEMDENGLALNLADFCKDSLTLQVSDAEEDGCTSFYVVDDLSGRRFKIMVRECGEDV